MSKTRNLADIASGTAFTGADETKLDAIATSANNYVHPDHSGEVTSTADGATVIASDVVDEDNLKISNTPTNGYVLTAQSGNTGGLTWAASSSGASLYAANEVSPGAQPSATNTNSIAIGDSAIASGYASAALGGRGNSATGSYSTAAGGRSNSVTGSYSAAAGGRENTISGTYSFGSGYANTVSSNYSAAFGNTNELTSGATFAFAHGDDGVATTQGCRIQSSGRFSAYGDAQGGQYILRADTTDATATVLTANNGSSLTTSNLISAASDTCIAFSGILVAMQNGAQAYGSWEIKGLLVNDGGSTTLANSAITVISNTPSWGVALSAGSPALLITVTGGTASIRWVANILTSEVTYA